MLDVLFTFIVDLLGEISLKIWILAAGIGLFLLGFAISNVTGQIATFVCGGAVALLAVGWMVKNGITH
jgi:hypothetical protein